MENKKICANCTQELDVGVDATRVDRGVIGMKDFVPLGETLLFCSEKCIEEYFDMGNLQDVPRRIP